MAQNRLFEFGLESARPAILRGGDFPFEAVVSYHLSIRRRQDVEVHASFQVGLVENREGLVDVIRFRLAVDVLLPLFIREAVKSISVFIIGVLEADSKSVRALCEIFRGQMQVSLFPEICDFLCFNFGLVDLQKGNFSSGKVDEHICGVSENKGELSESIIIVSLLKMQVEVVKDAGLH